MDVYASLLESLGIENHGIEKTKQDLRIQVDDDDDYVLDYNQEMVAQINCRKIHRYSREERFKSTLFQLLAIRGDVPPKIISLVRHFIGSRIKKHKLWNTIRMILKRNRLRFYYNRIPLIIKHLTGLSPLNLTYTNVNLILMDFSDMHYKFNQDLHKKWNRAYFLNLRFTAFKLMEKYNIHYPYYVPILRTYRKRKYLNSLFDDF